MFCKKCGEAVTAEMEFCGKCGTSVKDSNQVQTGGYTTAGIGRRISNYILDKAFLTAVVGVLNLTLTFTVFVGKTASFSYFITSLLINILLWLAYYLVLEGVWQKTPAKFITKTKVVMVDGSKPPFKNILGRTFARIIPFEEFSFLFSSFPVGWHDSLSKTIVVPAHYTQDDVKKINLEALKKNHGSNYAVIIIVALFSFFIIIAIIGILSSVVLVSLNSARQKGSDARTKSSLTQVRLFAETYYAENGNSYSTTNSCTQGMFTQPDIQAVLASSQNQEIKCVARESTYAISASLNSSEKSFCVDSAGYLGEGMASGNDASASCSASVDSVSTADWKAFTSTESSFSVMLPAVPIRSTTYSEPDSMISYVSEQYTSTAPAFSVIISKTKFSEPPNVSPEEVLQSTLSGMVSTDENSKLVSSASIKFGVNPALDYEIRNQGETLKGKLIMVDGSSMILILVDAFILDDADYNKIIDSFKLL